MFVQKSPLTFFASTDLAEGRFVTITKSDNTVAYTSAAAEADAITISEAESGEAVSVQMLSDTSSTFLMECGGTVSKGGNVEVGSDGKAVPEDAGDVVAIAKKAGVSGALIEGYNI